MFTDTFNHCGHVTASVLLLTIMLCNK